MKVNYYDLFNKHSNEYEHNGEDLIRSYLNSPNGWNCSINDLILDTKYGFMDIFDRECGDDFEKWMTEKKIGHRVTFGEDSEYFLYHRGKGDFRADPEMLIGLKAKYILETME